MNSMITRRREILFVLLLLVGSLLTPSAAQSHRSWNAGGGGVPPLIDRELIFGNPEIAGAQISPDGQFIAFIKPYKDTRNIWVKRTAEPFSAAKLITADTKRPIPAYFWSRDGKYILFVQDQAGDENFNVYAVNPAESPAAGRDAPPARNLTEAKGVRALIYDVSRKDPDVIHVGLNDRDAAWHDLYQVKISTGERTLLRKNTEKISAWIFDNNGGLRLALRTDDSGDNEILRVDADGFTEIYTCTVFETCFPIRFHKDGKRVYMMTNKDESDLIGLVLLDVETRAEQFVESDPLKRVDFGGARFSDLTNEILLTTYTDERTRRYFKDKALEADYGVLKAKLPGKEVGFASSTRDERVWLVSASADTEPGETYLFDRTSKQLTLQYRIREKLPREHLASMKSIRYKSSDGLEIPAYLTLPKGIPAKNLPLIVVPHGGPWARDGWGYSSLPQFLANRGYAVLQPNFRGSTGYGKTFLNAGNNEWGDKMQDDITWGVKHLIAEGIADPKRVGIIGGSYGGYATLAGVAFTPDVYAAGVSIVGPSNLLTLLETIPPYWEAIRKLFHKRMGDPTTPEGRKQLERQSPLNSATKIKTPLLVAQGANDPRVKQAESDQIVIALRDRGFPVEYIVAPDEGHGFARPVNNMSLYAAAEKFFAKHLNGRYQEDMTPEVTTRLKEITVDPKVVTLTKKVDPASIGAPKPVADLKPGVASYNTTIETGGQSMALSRVSEVKEEGGSWIVSETVKTPMGEGVDTATVEKGTLVLQKRTIKQGPVAIDLTFEGGKATGTMAMGGQSKPVSVDLGGPLFGDGPAGFLALAVLPLADGYTTTFRNFDVQKQKVALKQLKVTGTEDVTVPAGTFKAFKLEITSADGDPGSTTLWVATDSRQVVKVADTLPQMGGAKLTSELTKNTGTNER
jgi:dipeptidyl aminopeptidase/acylaminoacyl peptidase